MAVQRGPRGPRGMKGDNGQAGKDGAILIAVISNDISYIKSEITEINKKLESCYVTQVEFDPLKKIVYGLVGLLLTGVVGAILALVIIK